MSGLINRLLEKYYSTNPYKEQKEATLEKILQPHVKADPFKDVPTSPKLSEIRSKLKYCKNGHALDDRGRCFGKGCKYA